VLRPGSAESADGIVDFLRSSAMTCDLLQRGS
jgi:hypothetical protein